MTGGPALFAVGTGTLNNSAATATTIGNAGTITLAGGQITNTGGGTFTFSDPVSGFGSITGPLTIGSGGAVTASGGTLYVNGTINASGNTMNTGTAATDILDLRGTINGGFLYPSFSVGSLGKVYLDGATINGSQLGSSAFPGGTVNVVSNSTLTGAVNSYANLGINGGAQLNMSGATLNIDAGSGSSLTNNGTLAVGTGTLNNSTAVNNYGTVNNGGTIAGTGAYTQFSGQTIDNGAITQSAVAINGGSLSGTGSITGPVTIGGGGTVMPGNSPGTFTITGSLNSSGSLDFEFEGTGAGQFDVLAVNGPATFAGGTVNFDFINGFQGAAGDSWDFLSATSGITGWDSLTSSISGLGAGLTYQVDPIISGGNTIGEELRVSTAVSTAVPEPVSLIFFGTGLVGICGYVGRRRMR